MKKLYAVALLLVAAVLVVGCAAPAPSPTPAKPTSVVIGAATLAFAGTCEVDVAADYTTLILARQRATRALEAKRISVAEAIRVQDLGDSARRDLEAACPNKSAQLDRARLESARETLASILKLLEKKP